LPEVVHSYTDAADQAAPLRKIANVHAAIAPLPPDAIVVRLDGDDYLPHPKCLEVVKRAHDDGAWMTWGSFVFADGRAGTAAAMGAGEDPRTTPYRITHIKTYRAGLFQRIKEEDLKRDGEWLLHATDMAEALPIYEMCPPERRRYLAEILYVYDLGSSFEWSATEAELAREQEDVRYVRSRRPYARVESL
jgi:hypothetical protein